MADVTPILVSMPDGAKVIGIGISKMKELVASGVIESVKIDRRRLIPVDALDRYVDSLRGQAA